MKKTKIDRHHEERFQRALDFVPNLSSKELIEGWKKQLDREWRVEALKDFVKITSSHALVDVWSRPGLDINTRIYLNLAAMICLRSKQELKIYVGHAIRHGITPEQIVEVLLQMSAYAGMATANEGYEAILETFRELGIDQRKKPKK